MLAREMTRFEVQERIEAGDWAILPVGACEQHGPHLPLGTDVYLAEYQAAEIADRVPAVVFPSVNFGYSWVWKGLSGTLTLSQRTFNLLMYELIESLIEQGFNKIMVTNGHDSNVKALRYVQRDIADAYPDVELLVVFYPTMNDVYQRHMESPMWHGMFHAEEFETSLMLAYRGDLVHMDRAVCEYPLKPVLYGLDASSLATISTSGVYGDATCASRQKGEAMAAEFADYVAEIVRSL